MPAPRDRDLWMPLIVFAMMADEISPGVDKSYLLHGLLVASGTAHDHRKSAEAKSSIATT